MKVDAMKEINFAMKRSNVLKGLEKILILLLIGTIALTESDELLKRKQR